MNDAQRDRLDRMLDLLTEEVADRLRQENERPQPPTTGPQASSYNVLDGRTRDEEPAAAPDAGSEAAPAEVQVEVTHPATAEVSGPPKTAEVVEDRGGGQSGAESAAEPPSPPTSHTAQFLGRLTLSLLALVVVINIPFNRHGTTLATAMPDRRALVIRDGLVVTEEDDPEIYVYQDGQFRWISSLKAFEMRGYTWRDVHVVEDGFLEPYEFGPPIHVIVKCHDSPHIYRIEEEEKRWIVDIEAFEEAGYVWDDVEFVSCEYLRSLPDGETIPPGHRPAPRP